MSCSVEFLLVSSVFLLFFNSLYFSVDVGVDDFVDDGALGVDSDFSSDFSSKDISLVFALTFEAVTFDVVILFCSCL